MEISRAAISETNACMPQYGLGNLPDVIEIVLILILGLIVVAVGAWLIERSSKYGRAKFAEVFPDFIRARALEPYDPDWVLKRLFSEHPQDFSYRDIIEVVADCVPHEKEVWGDGPYAFFWFWVLKLSPRIRHNQLICYAYVAGF